MNMFNIQEVVELALNHPIDIDIAEKEIKLPYPHMVVFYNLLNMKCFAYIDEEEDRMSIIYEVVGKGALRFIYQKADSYKLINPDERDRTGFTILDEEQVTSTGVYTNYLLTYAIHLMNCKNTSLEEFDPNQELPKKRRQRLKRDGKKLVKYKILHISSLKKPSAKSDNHIGAGVALHSVRGHFVTYTEEAPLFGKPWGVGTYWVGPYISGNADFGMTKKDYYVEVEEYEIQNVQHR